MTTTIYFSGSISSGRQDLETYRQIVAALEREGLHVFAGAVTSEDVGAGGESIAPYEIYARDLAWVDAADILVAEVSVPSNGVGYEIAYARHCRNIPVIALWRPKCTTRCSAMIAGDPAIELIAYDEIEAMLPRLVESIRQPRRYPDRLP